MRDISELKLKTDFESKKISKYWDLKINLSIKLKRSLSTISFLKMIYNKTSLMLEIENFTVIINLILYCFDINIIIDDSKLNEIIIDLRFFYMRKLKKLLFFKQAMMSYISISISKKISFIKTSTRINCFCDMRLINNSEI